LYFYANEATTVDYTGNGWGTVSFVQGWNIFSVKLDRLQNGDVDVIGFEEPADNLEGRWVDDELVFPPEEGTGSATYGITYDGNGATSGTLPTDDTAYAEGSTVTVLGNTGVLDRVGYDFTGWNTAADGSGPAYAEGDTFTMGTAEVTLYAQWQYNSSMSDGTNTYPLDTLYRLNQGTVDGAQAISLYMGGGDLTLDSDLNPGGPAGGDALVISFRFATSDPSDGTYTFDNSDTGTGVFNDGEFLLDYDGTDFTTIDPLAGGTVDLTVSADGEYTISGTLQTEAGTTVTVDFAGTVADTYTIEP
jgi:uncharacterized repeat protein (TIGR02543 family)